MFLSIFVNSAIFAAKEMWWRSFSNVMWKWRAEFSLVTADRGIVWASRKLSGKQQMKSDIGFSPKAFSLWLFLIIHFTASGDPHIFLYDWYCSRTYSCLDCFVVFIIFIGNELVIVKNYLQCISMISKGALLAIKSVITFWYLESETFR